MNNKAKNMMYLVFFMAFLAFIGTYSALRNYNRTKPRPSGLKTLKKETIKPLLIGMEIPDIQLQTADGNPFDLKEQINGQYAVILFYRGGWCPYCNKHLAEIQSIESQIREMGYRILAISPDRPEELQKSMNSSELSYQLLSDSQMKAAKAFGIAFQVDDETLTKYKGFGIDLEAASGQDHHKLPVPSVFIIDKDGKIGFTYVNPDYKVRINPEVLLAAAKAVINSQ